MRVSRAFSRLLRLDGIWVRQVQFFTDRVVVRVALRRRRLICPLCAYSTPHRHNQQARSSRPGGISTSGSGGSRSAPSCVGLSVPSTGSGSRASRSRGTAPGSPRDFEQLVAWLATTTDKTTITRLVRIDWDTVGRIISSRVRR